MKHLTLAFAMLSVCGLGSGCATVRDWRAEIPANPETQVVIYEKKVELQDTTGEYTGNIRKNAYIINVDIRMDKQLGRYIIDVDNFETHGVRGGESIIWECDDGIPFTVHFGWDSPFEKGVYPAENTRGNLFRTNIARTRHFIPLDAKAIEYKYIIAAAVEYRDEKTGKLKTEVVVYDPLLLFLPPGYSYH